MDRNSRYAAIRRKREGKRKPVAVHEHQRYTILRTNSGPWNDAKRRWRDLGLRDDAGRAENLLRLGEINLVHGFSGTSMFDPVLTELAYRQYCPRGGVVIDPFAGGPTRGVVAGKLGRHYRGVDLRPEQLAENIRQRDRICPGADVRWVVGDGRDIASLFPGAEADFIFTCPPYGDTERYNEDDPRDLSNMAWDEYQAALRQIVANACALLRQDRFAAIVIGELRGDDGFLHDLPALTIEAFAGAGLGFYDRRVIAQPIGTAALRANCVTRHGKSVRVHQYLLTFVKGDGPRAKVCARGRRANSSN